MGFLRYFLYLNTNYTSGRDRTDTPKGTDFESRASPIPPRWLNIINKNFQPGSDNGAEDRTYTISHSGKECVLRVKLLPHNIN